MNPLFYVLSKGTKMVPVLIILVIAVIFLLRDKRTRVPTIIALIAWPIGNEICDVFKNTFQHLRPCVELADVNLRVEKLTSFGTISAHSANMMAVAVPFLFRARKVGYVWLVIAILTGISRIYVGVHYPYQVLGGWIAGGLVAMGLHFAWQWWERKKGIEPEEQPESSEV